MRRAALILLLLALLWAVDAAVGSGVFWVHDLRHHHLPWRVWAAGEWAAGRLPLWAPGVSNGFPLMADGQTGAFYLPGMLLFVLLPPALALNWSILLHVFWAGLGGTHLARSLGRSPGAALFAGVAFGFSGFMATHALYLGMQNAVAWLPWLLGFVVSRRWGLAGLSAWFMLLAGHPQAAAFGLLLAGVVALWREWALAQEQATAWFSAKRLPWAFGLAMALALVAASPQLAASWELVRFGMRDGGVSAAFANIGSLPPQELINGVLPRFFGFERPGDIAQTYYHRGTGYWGAGENHWEMAFYLGVPAVALAVAGLRRQRLWLGVALVSLLLMLGGHTPLWPILRHLPLLGGFRFPVRFSLVLTVAVAVLAAAGLDRLQGADASTRRRWSRGYLAAALVLLLGLGAGRAALHVGDGLIRDRLTTHFMAKTALPPPPEDLPPLLRAALPGAEPEDPRQVPAKVDRIMASLERSTSPWVPLTLLPVVALLGVGLAVRRGGRWLPLVLTGLLYADLWGFGAGYQMRVPRAMLEWRPGALDEILPTVGRGRVTVVDRRQDPSLDVDLMSASLGLLHGTRDVILTSPLLLVRNEALLSVVGLDVGDKGPQKVDRLAGHPALVDLLGVRFLLSVHDLTAAGYPHVPTGGGPVGLYENPDPLVGAWLVGCARHTTDVWTDLLALDPRHEAIVEGPAELPACVPDPGTAAIVEESPQRLIIDVQAAQPALLVQNDSWYPGWRARVDGVDAPVLLTDLVFRGIVVPAGAHRVTLWYRPVWLWPTLLSGMAALLGLLGWALVPLTQRRAN